MFTENIVIKSAGQLYSRIRSIENFRMIVNSTRGEKYNLVTFTGNYRMSMKCMPNVSDSELYF